MLTGRRSRRWRPGVRRATPARRRRTLPSLRLRPGPASDGLSSVSSTAATTRFGEVAPIERMLEQQRERPQHRRRIGDAGAGDVGRRAVDRLEDAGAAVAEARRRSQAETAGDGRGDVGEDVAEHVLGHDHVEAVGVGDELHRRAVDERMPQLDVGIVRRHLVDDPPPEARRVEHVRLVDRRRDAPLRLRASSNARRAMRSTCDGWYSHVSKTVPSESTPRRPK